MFAYWVLVCVGMSCGPGPNLTRTWPTEQECRQAVIKELNSRIPAERFTWRCAPVAAAERTKPQSAEELERP